MADKMPDTQKLGILARTEEEIKLLLSKAELSLKFFLGVSGFFYISGYTVVSLHLAHYEIAPQSLLKAQYVLAGVWAILPPLFGFIFVVLMLFLRNSYLARKKFPGVFGTLTWASLGFWILLGIFSRKLDYIGHWFFLLISIATVFSIFLISHLTLNADEFGPESKEMAWLKIFSFSSVIILVFFYIVTFEREIYHEIPSALGGGKPIQVWYQFKPGSKEKIEESVEGICGKEFIDKGFAYSQIMSNDHSYYAVPCPDKPYALEISKNVVEAVLIATD